MNVVLTNPLSRLAGLSWLAGPIFGKELRVSSRRRRNYWTRSVYLAFLTVFLVVIWLDVVDFANSSGTYIASRLARAGKQIIVILIWFQFYATQLVAVVMLSTAISDEIYHRTLGVLMTTPITSFQIVIGKLSSKLLQLILLLGISLPVLAVVRLFGGVPWDYIISSLCITLTALIFVGSLSLFFSTFSRKAYVVIVLTIVSLGLLFGLPVVLMGRISLRLSSRNILQVALCHTNPYVMLEMGKRIMLDPRWIGRIYFSWPVHCGMILTASVFVLIYCMRRVRKIALAQAAGRPNVIERLRRFLIMKFTRNTKTIPIDNRIRRVKGPPVVWKELKSRISSREKLIVAFVIGLEVAMIVAMYLFPFLVSALGLEQAHVLYIWAFMGLGTISAIVLPSTCITSEKESHSWPLLLITPLTDWQIVFGKFIGVLRRSMFIWLLLFVYVGLFWIFRSVGSLALLHFILIITGTIVFLSGTGFYFSSRLKSTSMAVIANIMLAVLLWGVVPLLLGFFREVSRGNYLGRMIYIGVRDLGELYLSLVPFIQARVVMVSTFTRSYWSSYRWPYHNLDPLESTYYIFVVMLFYVLVGLLFAWRATRRFRRNIF